MEWIREIPHASFINNIVSSLISHNIVPRDAYLFESFSMRTWIVEFANVLKAYIFKSPSNDIETSSAINKASLSHHVPASEIPPPSPPSPTFQKDKREHFVQKFYQETRNKKQKNYFRVHSYIDFSIVSQILILPILIVVIIIIIH